MEVTDRKRPIFGCASLIFTALTVATPVLVFFYFAEKIDAEPEGKKSGWDGLALVFLTLILGGLGAALASLGGVVSGIIGLVRHERLKGLSIIGLILSGAVLLTFIGLYVTTQIPAPGN